MGMLPPYTLITRKKKITSMLMSGDFRGLQWLTMALLPADEESTAISLRPASSRAFRSAAAVSDDPVCMVKSP